MLTGKGLDKGINNARINTIKALIVFILVFIFMCFLWVDVTYADKDEEETEDLKQVVVSKDYNFEEQNGNLEVKVRCGINGVTKVGTVTAIIVDITNSGNQFEGFIQVGIPQSKEGTLYSEKISVGSNETKTVNIYLPVNIQTTELKLEILTTEGTSCLKSDVKIKTHPKGCYMIGLLADTPSALTYLLSNKDSRYYYYSKDTIPSDYRALDTIDILFINNYNVGLLSEEQYGAIKEWVMQGGTLVIGTGAGAGTVLNRFSKDFISAKVSSVDSMEISFGTTKSESESSEDVVAEDMTWLKTNVATIDLEDAITIESASSRPIIQSVNKGKGKVIVCGFNMKISNTYADMQDKLGDIVYTYSAVESEAMYTKFLKSILESAKGNTPNALLYIVMLGVYIIIIIGMIAVYSRKLNTYSVAKLISIVSVAMCLVLGVMGIGTRINKMHSSHFSLLNLEGNNIVNVEKFFNVTLPNNKERSLELKEKNHFFEISQNDGSTKEASGTDFNTEITRDGETTNVKLKGLAAFDTKIYESYGKYESKINMNASINCWDNVYSGTIENNTGQDLDYVFIITKSAIVYVGDVAKDEKASENSMKQGSYVSINELERVVPDLLGKKIDLENSNSIDSKGEMTVSGITRILQYYMISNGVPSSNEGCLLAITKSKDKVFVNNNIDEEGINVITSNIKVNYSSGNQIYVPNICKDKLSFEVGNYYYSTTTNTVQLMDSVVAEYILDKKQNVNSIKFEDKKIEKDNETSFKGSVSFWNYKTSQYEVVYTNGQDVEITNVANYISSSKVIKIKFEVAEGSSGCTLPIISAIVTN